MLSDRELPPLPAKTLLRRVMPDDFRYGDVIGYTADQMREYARAVERAAYKRAEQKCEEIAKQVDADAKCEGLTENGRLLYEGMWGGAKNCILAIRALGGNDGN